LTKHIYNSWIRNRRRDLQ